LKVIFEVVVSVLAQAVALKKENQLSQGLGQGSQSFCLAGLPCCSAFLKLAIATF